MLDSTKCDLSSAPFNVNKYDDQVGHSILRVMYAYFQQSPVDCSSFYLF